MPSYGTNADEQHLLPSYSPSVSRSARNSLSRSYGDASTAPGWPVTFEAGVETVLQSPASASKLAELSVTLDERSRILVEEMGELGEAKLLRGTSSRNEAIFNAINVLLGAGVLSCPFALRSSGWLIGLPLFVFFALVTNHTGKLLGKCLEYQEGMMTYPDIGEAAYGTKGRIMISVVFFSELVTGCVMFTILIGDTLAALIPAYTAAQLQVAAFLVIMPTLWTSHLSMLSWFSLLGVISSLFCLYVIVYIGFAIDYMDPSYTMGSLIHPPPNELIADADRIPLAIGLTMVTFGGHSVFPSICSSLKDRADYPVVLNVAYIVTFFVYGAIEICGYIMFGTSTTKEITLNLIDVYPGSLTTAMICMIAFNPMSKLPITIHPVALAIEELLLSPEEMFHETRRVKILRAFVRTTLGVITLLGAIFIPHFARLTSFLGAFFAMFASLCFPCVCYLKLYGHRLSLGEKLLNTSLAVISVVFTIVGTIASFASPAE
ncbi:hypothetical protein Poli38472_010624 [Pythium oligandrum]|uniref:Amino acid transporter transmembrane domain-containing protein n=1 Tax=Pythium oligandrum TaxID=41045 RepID=A0A8K1FDM4_PYTOL|nr:hypothetical protein Poli38472_010624 [Pythium oligandrum]|eukprot:TMW55742.1 hypothetical protein Poli38472_010624 [Pythium oligandrum]